MGDFPLARLLPGNCCVPVSCYLSRCGFAYIAFRPTTIYKNCDFPNSKFQLQFLVTLTFCFLFFLLMNFLHPGACDFLPRQFDGSPRSRSPLDQGCAEMAMHHPWPRGERGEGRVSEDALLNRRPSCNGSTGLRFKGSPLNRRPALKP